MIPNKKLSLSSQDKDNVSKAKGTLRFYPVMNGKHFIPIKSRLFAFKMDITSVITNAAPVCSQQESSGLLPNYYLQTIDSP